MAVSGLLFGLLMVGLIALIGALAAVFLLKRNQRDPAPSNGSFDDNVRSPARSGRQIEAIKLVRRQTGMGLKEAKNYVDQIERSTPSS